jgi:hypothetical protein
VTKNHQLFPDMQLGRYRVWLTLREYGSNGRRTARSTSIVLLGVNPQDAAKRATTHVRALQPNPLIFIAVSRVEDITDQLVFEPDLDQDEEPWEIT